MRADVAVIRPGNGSRTEERVAALARDLGAAARGSDYAIQHLFYLT